VKNQAPRIQIHDRALWEAIRSAGGNVTMAAHSLGLTTRDLLLRLSASKMSWPHKTENAVSGTRPRSDEVISRRDSDDELAWGDDGDSE